MENNIEKSINLSVDEVNKNMHVFLDNKNDLGRINTKLVNEYGKEYYLSELSDTLISSFNTFEKFYPVVNNQELYSLKLMNLSIMALEFFKIETKERLGKMSIFKKRRILKTVSPYNKEKFDALLKALDDINEIINTEMGKK